MRLNLTVVDGRSGRACDALVDVDPQQPARDLVAPLVGVLGDEIHAGFTRRVPWWVDGVEVVGDPTVGEAGVRPGCVVSLYEPSAAGAGPVAHGVAELRVVAGPGAGRVRRLPLGQTVVGCGGGWSLPDVRLPADALTVTVLADGTVTLRASEELEVRVDEGAGTARVTEESVWTPGDHVFAGDTVLALVEPDVHTAEVTAEPAEAVVDFNRPPRLLPPEREHTFHLPDPVAPVRARAVPWVMVLAPMALAVPMALFFGPRFLLFGLFSPVLAMANFVNDRRTSRKDNLRRKHEYAEQHADVTGRIERALVVERTDRRSAAPDPAALLLTALGPGPRLWERRAGDQDYLRFRVGLTRLPAAVTVEQRRDKTAEEAPPPMLEGVPAWLDLEQLRVVGLAGETETRDALAQWLVAQAVLLHSPRDLRLTVLTDKDGEDRWGWTRWVPHARADDESGVVLLGTAQESVGRRLAELGRLIATREEQLRDRVRPTPDVLVVLDGARRLRTLPAVVDLLRRGPSVGVTVLCLDDEVRQLPEECRAVVVCEAGRVRISESSSADTEDIVPDLVEPSWSDAVARAVAPLRDTTPEEEAGGVPDSARLLELVDLRDPTAEGIGARWVGRPTTDVVVGAGYDGPFRLDLRRDGPHALVAGTTGAGKSELLQTLVASLAIANRPDQLTFVLVDYKGGSAFKDCALLPHTVGMVTDLDSHLVERALTSLGAELRRREHLLADAGAKDLEDYWALQERRPDLAAIPRLVLVIDEFASLVAELPDFVQGLVSIAQRGRSLGIHLVLATQRPSGVVSADIRANTNLRIALRVTDENDSRDVIDAADAARIAKSTPGRAYARSGAATLMPFQTGRVGGRRPDAREREVTAPEPLAWPVPWEQVGQPAPGRPVVEGATTDEGETDLSVLVRAISVANDLVGVPPQHRPWLDALPEVVLRGELPAPRDEADEADEEAETAGVPGAPWMLEDLPAQQLQRSRTYRPGRDGHLYVIGGPRSGRSTAMRTLATALADALPVRDLHVYGLDCGNGALLGLEALPHTGAVVTRTQTDRADRLLARLVELVEERQRLLGRGGFADLGEYRASRPVDERPPYVVFFLDRWDGFSFSLGEIDGGRMTDQVMRILRDGEAVGVHAVVSGDRSLVTGRMSTLVEDRIVLRLADKGDYGIVGIPNRAVPDAMPEGRALTPDPLVEGQVAVLSPDLSGAGQNDAVRAVAQRHRERDLATPAELRPMRLLELPSELSLADEDWARIATEMDGATSPGWVPVGVGGDDLRVMGLDLSATPVALVAGPPRSGRTGLLRFVARASRRAGHPVLAVCPVANELSRDLEVEDAVLHTDGLEPDVLVERLRACEPGTVVLVDDAELLKDGPLSQALLALVQQARTKQWRVVVAGGTSEIAGAYGGWIYELRKARQGLLLSPQAPGDGDVHNLRLMRSALLPRTHPGRGLLIDAAGGQETVQVPLVTA